MSEAVKQPMTPVYLKTDVDQAWPEDAYFYLLSSDGMFLCRNHPFFSSCVEVEKPPSDLAEQDEFLKIKYPKIPKKLMESIVGFFDCIYKLHDGESAVLLVFDQNDGRIKMVVPDQVLPVYASTWRKGGGGFSTSMDVEYETPTNLPPHLTVIGDAHSHCNMSATSSWTDDKDEKHRPGLHVIVGRLNDEPPQVKVEAVVDGTRFTVEEDLVIEGYGERQKSIPQEWIDKVKLEERKYKSYGVGSYQTGFGFGDGYDYTAGYGSGGGVRKSDKGPDEDKGSSGFGFYGTYAPEMDAYHGGDTRVDDDDDDDDEPLGIEEEGSQA